MARDFAGNFYQSKTWIKCRKSYVSKRVSIDGGLCERCQSTIGVITHHIKHITPLNINDPEITLNHDNLEYLCMECHAQEHNANSPTVKGLRFNSKGELVET